LDTVKLRTSFFSRRRKDTKISTGEFKPAFERKKESRKSHQGFVLVEAKGKN